MSPGTDRLLALTRDGITDAQQFGNVIANFPAERPQLYVLLQQRFGNAMVAAARAWAERHGQSPVVYFGMNAGAAHEVAALHAGNSDRGGVVAITAALGDNHSVAQALAALQLPRDVLAVVRTFLSQPSQIDERLAFVRYLALADRGAARIERLVLSGHSDGDSIFGVAGELALAELASLREVFPRAFGQVKHVLLAACSTGYRTTLAQRLPEIFSNVVTVTGYAGTAPGAKLGAVRHLKTWEAATDDADETRVARRDFYGTRKGRNIATWSAAPAKGRDAYQAPPGASQRTPVDQLSAELDLFWFGSVPAGDSQAGPLRNLYQRIQQTLGELRLDDVERPRLEFLRDRALRVLYFAEVVTRYVALHATALASAFRELGRAEPTWALLSRGEVVSHLSGAPASPNLTNSARTTLDHAYRSLVLLDAQLVPNAWL